MTLLAELEEFFGDHRPHADRIVSAVSSRASPIMSPRRLAPHRLALWSGPRGACREGALLCSAEIALGLAPLPPRLNVGLDRT
jgi:hypothetical protein